MSESLNSTSASQNYFGRSLVQHDEQFQRGSGIGKPVGEKFKIDLRVQGCTTKKQSIKMKIERGDSEDWRIFFKNKSKEQALITDLHKTDTFNPFSEESKIIMHNRVPLRT